METIHQVMGKMAHLDRMRAAALNMEKKGDRFAPLTIKVIDAGDAMCREYMAFYAHLRENPDDFGTALMKRRYHEKVEPLEKKYDSLAALLGEQLGEFFEREGVFTFGDSDE